MGRLGSFLPRLLALTAVWLLATTALTYAAAQRMSSPKPPAATTATTTSAAATRKLLTVPDVKNQAYVFAEGTLSDAGFGWRVDGPVQGYAANTVATQTPAAGTQVIDTGLPTIVLTLARGGREAGVPQNASPLAGTKLELAFPAAKPRPVAKAKPARTVQATVAPKKKAPAHRWPQHRPPAFVVPGTRREPLDEMPLTDRAKLLLRWVATKPKPTDANVKYWLYQHAWIVTGAEMGWWHGADALRTLLTVDDHVWGLWGIGDRSKAVAEQALREVEARSS